MLRDHVLCRITRSYHREQRQSTGGGETEHAGFEASRYTEVLYVIMPSVEYATVWAKDGIKYMRAEHDAKIDQIEDLGPPRAVLIMEQY